MESKGLSLMECQQSLWTLIKSHRELFRDGPLEKLWEAGLWAKYQKKNTMQGKLSEKKFMHAE